jgi:trans-aconitate methyltransferase
MARKSADEEPETGEDESRNRDGGQPWNTDLYESDHRFVYEYGQGVVDLLDPHSDERVLDLGCGTGHLTAEIADRADDSVGTDISVEMVAHARETYPDGSFVRADARALPFESSFDAVFSNAAFHWIDDQDAVCESIRTALRPGGRLVAEFGGKGNIKAIVNALETELRKRGYDVRNPWYFPSIGEYASLLESHGFEVAFATLFDRPTALDGTDGIQNWLSMFCEPFFEPVPDENQDAIVDAVEQRLRPELYYDESWHADYRRIRIVALIPDA